MKTLALLLIGFSLFYVIHLLFTHFRGENYMGQRRARVMGMALSCSLAGLQWGHLCYLQGDTQMLHGSSYLLLMFLVAPTFYLFSQPLLKAQGGFHLSQVIHALPLLLVFTVPHETARMLAFGIGSGYLLWLGNSVYALRAQRRRFQLELIVLAVLFVIALIVLIAGLGMPLVSEELFVTLYACAIGMAFFLISLVLSYTPQLSSELAEAARETYAVSTLQRVDCEGRLKQLKGLMERDKLYQDNELDLQRLAGRLELSGHQLSELMNTRLGMGFSRYMREQRVAAAKVMLLQEPAASVLSVGLSVGFTSQSSFYSAFREITGTTPASFRRLANSG